MGFIILEWQAHVPQRTPRITKRGGLMGAHVSDLSADRPFRAQISLPTYRKPFDVIFQRAKNEDWSALADDFRTFVVTASVPDLAFVECARL